MGHVADVVADDAAAFRAWQSGGYKLLITELHVPKMGRYALTRTIRDAEDCAAYLPILALTANAIIGDAEKTVADGMNAYFTKPVDLSAPKHALDEWLPKQD